MPQNNQRLPRMRAGLRVSLKFESRSHCSEVPRPHRSDVVCNQIVKYMNGEQVGYIYGKFGVVRAFANWLTPLGEGYETRRAQWSSHNIHTGELEADVYPEYVADVLVKIARLRPSEVYYHSVSL